MPLQATSGAASYDAFGGGMAVPNYIEEVFSTWLYTGNGSTQTINNGIDLAGKGGLVWLKSRTGAYNNYLTTTATGLSTLGGTRWMYSNTTDALIGAVGNGLTAFNSNGFDIRATGVAVNGTGENYASWTFREQPKFFDVVTYTGTGSARTVAHNLGSVPGCIIVKRTDTGGTNWAVYHRSNNGGSNPQNFSLFLNTTDASFSAGYWNNTEPTSTVFSLGVAGTVNESGGTYVAYLFAHNAGGFGLTGTDNVISCGSYSGTSATQQISLGFEPQWILVKDALAAGTDWIIIDNMRGMSTTSAGANVDRALRANAAIAEYGSSDFGATATGFIPGGDVNNNGNTYIYIAIRRGPMRTPTTGTSVLGLNARAGTGANATVTGGAGVTDLAIIKRRNSTPVWAWASRLTGTGYLSSNATTAETAAGTTMLQANPWDVMDGVKVGTTSDLTNASSGTFINYLIDRAPGFFDEVCYTGTGNTTTQNVTHNLGVKPQLMLVKSRGSAVDWQVYSEPTTATHLLVLNSTAAAAASSSRWNNTEPTSSVFTVGPSSGVNASGVNYVAYLFASCPGVSKVFNYTGNGSSQTINCGFTGGARFVMIKRTDSTGDWYVWDTARGVVANNDPHLSLNSTAAEVTTNDTIDTDSTGFVVNQVAATNVNVSSATYIGLAIA